MLTSAAAVEVGQYSEEEGGGNGDGVSTLLQHLLIPPHHLHNQICTVLYSVRVCVLN